MKDIHRGDAFTASLRPLVHDSEGVGETHPALDPIEATLEATIGPDICGGHAVVGRTSDPVGFSVMLSTACADAGLAGERVVDIKFAIDGGIMAAIVVVEAREESA